jgi:hypothetical protein
MPTNRIHHRTAVLLVSAVGLLLALGVQAGLSAVATETSDAGTSGALQGKVRIRLDGTLTVGPECVRVATGRFTLSGATSDRGTFVHRYLGCHTPMFRFERTLYGRKGTILVVGEGRSWRVTGGTKAYAGLRGRGHQVGRVAAIGHFGCAMTGTVSQ